MEPATVRDVVCQSARIRVTEAGRGRPLLLVHDFLSDHGEWAAVEGALARQHRVISVDLPGFGESEKPPPSRFGYDFDRFAQALVDVAGALDAAPMSLCGHGLGAAIGMALAERHPSMVERLVLVCPTLFGSRPLGLARAFGLAVVGPLAFKQLTGRRAMAWHFRRDVFAENPPGDDRIERLFEAFNPPAAREAANATFQGLLDTRTLEARLARIGSPALVVWGRRDRLAPSSLGKRLARALPTTRLELLDCGHSPAEEMPERFASMVAEFLAPARTREARA